MVGNTQLTTFALTLLALLTVSSAFSYDDLDIFERDFSDDIMEVYARGPKDKVKDVAVDFATHVPDLLKKADRAAKTAKQSKLSQERNHPLPKAEIPKTPHPDSKRGGGAKKLEDFGYEKTHKRKRELSLADHLFELVTRGPKEKLKDVAVDLSTHVPDLLKKADKAVKTGRKSQESMARNHPLPKAEIPKAPHPDSKRGGGAKKLEDFGYDKTHKRALVERLVTELYVRALEMELDELE